IHLIGQGRQRFEAGPVEEHQALVFGMVRADHLDDQSVGLAARAGGQSSQALHDLTCVQWVLRYSLMALLSSMPWASACSIN
ncbi:hypothetical protein, partial [Pseudomonas sp. DP16D-R1]|uniref:hypothetical protein n=1 Tax=Pseudomonas sp. DP16D-R1 TaxID=2075551 RepID=UPI001A916074